MDAFSNKASEPASVPLADGITPQSTLPPNDPSTPKSRSIRLFVAKKYNELLRVLHYFILLRYGLLEPER
jgi:hypothetical protein